MTASRSADPRNTRRLEDRGIVEALIACLSSPCESMRNQTTLDLARLGAAALEPLVYALGDDDPNVRIGASKALQLMGSPAIAKLRSLLQSENEAWRTDAALTLAHMRSQDAIDSIVAALREGALGEHYLEPLMESATG